MANKQGILWLKEISSADTSAVGGKTSSLGELYNKLRPLGIRVPNGFAISANIYRNFLIENKLVEPLKELFRSTDFQNEKAVTKTSFAARQLILSAPLSPRIEQLILNAYHTLSKDYEEALTDVAVRSSATAEDLPEASFAGQQETYLNIRGDSQLLQACRKCFASLFTARAISYRNRLGFDDMKVNLSVCVQKMVRSDLAGAGVIFTLDTESGFQNVILISAAYGLGENIVQGSVIPDEYTIFKNTLENYSPILKKELGTKEYKLIYDTSGEKLTKNIPVSQSAREQFVLSDTEILSLARWAVMVENHYSKINSKKTPMDLEWAKDGITGELYILQARPETVHSRRPITKIIEYQLKEKGTVLLRGHSVGNKIASGRVRIIKEAADRFQLQPGEILVADKTDPDWEPVMKLAAAIVTNRGGRTCHAAIVSRELGLPAIVGAVDATQILQNGQAITVSCAEGAIGNIYDGKIEYSVREIDLENLALPKTKIMMNIANPNNAFALSFLPQSGVGLAREEFIISNHIKIHPMALVKFDALKDQQAKNEIEQLTKGYSNKIQYFIDKLAEGISLITAAFYPKDVIVRLSDFKSNEYTHLIGGKEFETQEENPMLGFRGAFRYYHPNYSEGFALECRALKKVREEMGLTNLKVMVPFCRTPEEGIKVLEEMRKYGIVRGKDGLEIYMMCEIPSNIILAETFFESFDGFSIGSNDLTQLILGVDRDSSIVAPLFDERNPAVLSMISSVIRMAKSKNKKIGICGQAPSDYPEFAEFLVREGIDSISLNADSILRTTETVLKEEQKRGKL